MRVSTRTCKASRCLDLIQNLFRRIRFRALITYDDGHGDGKHRDIYELKGIQRPGIFPLATQAIPAAPERFQRSIELELGTSSTHLYFVRKVLGQDMLIRPRWKGNRGIALKDYHAKEVQKIAEDEAGVLGELHRRSADHPKKYEEAFRALSKADWKAMARRLGGMMQETYRRVAAP